MPGLKYLKGVATLRLDEDNCTGCGMCEIVCPHGVFEMANGKAAIADLDSCMECGACALNCEFGAIEVESGVGCAEAIIIGAVRGTEPTCDCCSKPEEPCC
jgi:NAD-dependent dihydropyrimidine dehydrogenase PreA subunit